MTKQKIGIALGSGAARGWSHIGVLQVLEEEGIKPDIVTGCSMGALVGAAYIADELEALHQWAIKISWREMADLIDIDLTSGGLIEGKRLMDFFQTVRGDAPIENFKTPFTAIATDLMTGREIWLEEGSLVGAVRASIALPGLLSPVKQNGKWLLDGGLVNPVPVSAARARGADIIIAVNLNGGLVGKHVHPKLNPANADAERSVPMEIFNSLFDRVPKPISTSMKKFAPDLFKPGSKTPGYFDVGATAINIMQDQITRARLAGEPPHVMLSPQLQDLKILDFNRAEEAVEEGRRVTKYALPAIRDLLD